ncbi:MAG: GGDEF domain-containing protein, partial [Pseudomonadota bacterium]
MLVVGERFARQQAPAIACASPRDVYRFGISLAPILIALIVTIAGIGGFVIVEKYQTLKAQTGADAEMNRLRNGVVAILDLVSVHNKLDLTLEDGRLDSKAGRELVEAVDALYLRADTFEKLAAERPDPAAKHLIGQLGALIQVFDAAVAGGYQELEVKKFTFEQLIQQTISSIVNYYDIQKFSHLSAVQRQDEMLTHLVEIVVLMLGAFIAITLVSLVLWRSEQRARVRGRAAEERARHLAYFDTLTGLPNRASFLLEGDRALSENALPALFLIDLDEFKEINDTHGHPVGDAVLQGLGDRIRAAFEEQSGFAARLGGDEFAAVLPEHKDIESLEGFGARLLERLGQPLLVEGLRLHPRVSVGIATPDMIEEDDSRSLKSLLRAADYALYRAKADGRFTSRIYNAEMAAALAHRRMLKQSMPAALEDEEFY